MNRKYVEAKEIYEQAAKLNKREIPAYLLSIPLESPSEVDFSFGSNNSSKNSEDADTWSSIWHVLKTPCLLKRLLILFCIW